MLNTYEKEYNGHQFTANLFDLSSQNGKISFSQSGIYQTTLSSTLAAKMHLSNLGFGNHILMFMTMTQSCFMGKEAHNEPSIF